MHTSNIGFSHQPAQVGFDIIGPNYRIQQGFDNGGITLAKYAFIYPSLIVLARVALTMLDHAAITLRADSLQVRTACVTDNALWVPWHLCFAAVVLVD